LLGLKKNSVYSIESGLKYFILGALVSSFFLLGLKGVVVSCVFGIFMPLAVFEYLISYLIRLHKSNKNCLLSFYNRFPNNLVFSFVNILNDPVWRSFNMPKDSVLNYVELSELLTGAMIVLCDLKIELAQTGEFLPEELDFLFYACQEGVKELFSSVDYRHVCSEPAYREGNSYWESTKLYREKPRLPKELIEITCVRLYEFQNSLYEGGNPKDVKLINATRAVLHQLDTFLSLESKQERMEFFTYVPNKRETWIGNCYHPITKYVEESERNRSIERNDNVGSAATCFGLFWFTLFIIRITR
jgi:hypothetical protein